MWTSLGLAIILPTTLPFWKQPASLIHTQAGGTVVWRPGPCLPLQAHLSLWAPVLDKQSKNPTLDKA